MGHPRPRLEFHRTDEDEVSVYRDNDLIGHNLQARGRRRQRPAFLPHLVVRRSPRLEEDHRPPHAPRDGRPLDRHPPIPRLTSPFLHQGAPPHRRGSAFSHAAMPSNRSPPGVCQGPPVRRRRTSPRRRRRRARAFVRRPALPFLRPARPNAAPADASDSAHLASYAASAARPPAAFPAFVPPFQGTETEPHRSAFPCRGVPRTSSQTGFQSTAGRRETPSPTPPDISSRCWIGTKNSLLGPVHLKCANALQRFGEPVARRRSARQREAKRRREEARREAASPRCPVCNAKMPSVLTGRQVTCGADRCMRERRRRMTRARVARFRTRRRP